MCHFNTRYSFNLFTLCFIWLLYSNKQCMFHLCLNYSLTGNKASSFVCLLNVSCEPAEELWSQNLHTKAMHKVYFIFQAARWVIAENLGLRFQCPGIRGYLFFDLCRVQDNLIFLGNASFLILKLGFSLFAIML